MTTLDYLMSKAITSVQSVAHCFILENNGLMSGFLVNNKTAGSIHTVKGNHTDCRCPVFNLCAFCPLQPQKEILRW